MYCPKMKLPILAFMDTYVASGRARGVVVEIGMNTAIGKIAEMIQGEEAKNTSSR